MSKIKVLFLAANPTGTSHLKLDEEIRAISEKICASPHRDQLDLVSVWAVRPDDLLQSLNLHKPHIVHFSGHGISSGEIILLDDNGQPKPISVKALQNLFSSLKDNIQVVVLNACYSQLQAEALIEVVDCAIGMTTAIGDKAAIVFAASFYRAIGFGKSVQNAFEQGKTALSLERMPEKDTPVILRNTNVDPSEIILVTDTDKTNDSYPKIDSNHQNSYFKQFKRCSSLNELLQTAIQEIEKVSLTDYNQIFLSVTEKYSAYLRCVASIAPKHKQRYDIATYEGLLGKAFLSGSTLNVPNIYLEPRYFSAVHETKSELIVPIKSRNSVIGVINSESEEIFGFDSAICSQVEQIASALGELLLAFGWSGTNTQGSPSIKFYPAIDKRHSA